jgi:hypothetical protein
VDVYFRQAFEAFCLSQKQVDLMLRQAHHLAPSCPRPRCRPPTFSPLMPHHLRMRSCYLAFAYPVVSANHNCSVSGACIVWAGLLAGAWLVWMKRRFAPSPSTKPIPRCARPASASDRGRRARQIQLRLQAVRAVGRDFGDRRPTISLYNLHHQFLLPRPSRAPARGCAARQPVPGCFPSNPPAP